MTVRETEGGESRTEPTAAGTIVPLQTDRIIRARPDGGREALDSHWGLIPTWATGPGGAGRRINARAESLMTTASFRPLVVAHRCIVPATAFFEWMNTPTGRREVAIRRTDGRPLALAALWTTWTDPATRSVVTSHVIITCEPNALMRRFHHRLPVVLDGDALDAWLDPTVRDPAAVLSLLRPCPDDLLRADTDEPQMRPRPASGQLPLPLDGDTTNRP